MNRSEAIVVFYLAFGGIISLAITVDLAEYYDYERDEKSLYREIQYELDETQRIFYTPLEMVNYTYTDALEMMLNHTGRSISKSYEIYEVLRLKNHMVWEMYLLSLVALVAFILALQKFRGYSKYYEYDSNV